jgi:hypothetical protein
MPISGGQPCHGFCKSHSRLARVENANRGDPHAVGGVGKRSDDGLATGLASEAAEAEDCRLAYGRTQVDCSAVRARGYVLETRRFHEASVVLTSCERSDVGFAVA